MMLPALPAMPRKLIERSMDRPFSRRGGAPWVGFGGATKPLGRGGEGRGGTRSSGGGSAAAGKALGGNGESPPPPLLGVGGDRSGAAVVVGSDVAEASRGRLAWLGSGGDEA
jgi:hypothetical protein